MLKEQKSHPFPQTSPDTLGLTRAMDNRAIGAIIAAVGVAAAIGALAAAAGLRFPFQGNNQTAGQVEASPETTQAQTNQQPAQDLQAQNNTQETQETAQAPQTTDTQTTTPAPETTEAVPALW
jgi:hypothetical protein